MKSAVILGKLTGKHLWWSLFSGFRSATLVKNILMNKPFSVSGCKRLWTSASESNLRTSTILFVLPYIRYKGRVKNQIWASKVYPWLYCQVNHQLQRRMHLFLHIFFQFFVLLKVKSLVHLQVRHRVPPHVYLLLNCFLNSFVLASAPSCASSNETQLQPKVHP